MTAAPTPEALPPAILEGIRQFNSREFYECHDTIEEHWVRESRPVREFYQGILQIGVAFHHVLAQNPRGALKMLERGIPKLEAFLPACEGVDVAALKAQALACRAAIERLDPGRVGDFDVALFPLIRVDGEIPFLPEGPPP